MSAKRHSSIPGLLLPLVLFVATGLDAAEPESYAGNLLLSIGMGAEYSMSHEEVYFYSEASVMYFFNEKWMIRGVSSPILYYQPTDSFCNFIDAGYRTGRFVFFAGLGLITQLPDSATAGLAANAGVLWFVPLNTQILLLPQVTCVKSLAYSAEVLNVSAALSLSYRFQL